MRRADRLFQIIQILRRGELTTAAQLASELEVSPRTIYRDIRDLMASNVPIEGEAGVGYLLADGFDLPPLMFSRDEVEALTLGARMVTCWGDKHLAQAARDILTKVDAVLPIAQKDTLNKTSLYSWSFKNTDQDKAHMGVLRYAIRSQHKVRLTYINAKDEPSERMIRPLCLSFFAPHWILTAWCEYRNSFRNFRLDRIRQLNATPDTFENEPGRTLDDFMEQVSAEA
ncbi:MAG: YafY family transcriptional regulator [Planctomycetes bacterium]|nr:YafY family transcriptional regulator [Planctomycetota bacterium]